ncbi:MAG: WYL domain-containing protein [Paludibacteraceae bacterium]|nr:WYL domain-containing protein [Paludibacteraceae bacterium]
MSRTTFNRNRDALLDMFGIVIDCKRRGGNAYYIFNEDELSKETVQNWMYSTLSLSTLLSEHKRLFDRILVEYIPSADRYLQLILEAMFRNRQLIMTYKRYEFDIAKTYTASPYCVKLHNRRWYALMDIRRKPDAEPHLVVFALDRIRQLELTDTRFKIPSNFNASKFFSECYGVVVGDGTLATTIRLRAFGRERYALLDLPIHHSQRLVSQSDDHFDYEVFLRPTADFKAFLASKGRWLVIISPKWLADDIVKLHQEAIAEYQDLMLSFK